MTDADLTDRRPRGSPATVGDPQAPLLVGARPHRSSSRPTTASCTRSTTSTFDVARPRDARDRGGVRLGQERDARWRSSACCPKSAKITGDILFRGESLLERSEKELEKIRGAGDRDDLPGRARGAEPRPHGRASRSPRRSASTTDVSDKRRVRERAIELLDIVGIPNPSERVDQYPHEYSGGMRQRAMIAMSIANDPDAADRRRADDRARRHDPGAGARGARAHPGPHAARRSS